VLTKITSGLSKLLSAENPQYIITGPVIFFIKSLHDTPDCETQSTSVRLFGFCLLSHFVLQTETAKPAPQFSGLLLSYSAVFGLWEGEVSGGSSYR
jgi:hypothetical protein